MKTRWHKQLSRRLRRALRRRVLASHGVAVLADTDNGLLLVDPGDFHVGRRLLESGRYDLQEIHWLRAVLGDRLGEVLVVGVHVGALLVPLAAFSERVTGFEADPDNHRLASLNLRLNGLSNARVHHRAVGAEVGRVNLRPNPINTGNTSVRPAPGGEGTVEMVPLDRYCTDAGIEGVDLLVMDIEGHELHALRGATDTLACTRALYVEYAPEQLREHGSDPAEMVALLCEAFPRMHIHANPARSFTAQEARRWLGELPETRGLLLNLLFTR